MKIRIRSDNTEQEGIPGGKLILENVETGEGIKDIAKLTLHLDCFSPVEAIIESVDVNADSVKRTKYSVFPRNIDLTLDFDCDKRTIASVEIDALN